MATSGTSDELLRTPLHARHLELGATMANFGGWDMPIEYSGTVAEHNRVREAVGMFDVSHMGYLEITGPHAADWLNGIVTNDLRRVNDGEAQYTLLCTTDGGVIDDLIAYRGSDDFIFCVPNAANSDEVVRVFTQAADDSPITVTDKRNEVGIIAVQGPASASALGSLGLPVDHDYMSFAHTHWNDWDVTVARTGYTGELGYEIICPAPALESLWNALLDAGVTPSGLGARDTLRTEMGYPLHGHELSADITGVQARLSWAIGWDKPDFHGAEALRAERERGPHRILRGLIATDRGVPRAGMSVHDDHGSVIGATTSGTFSPTLRRGIALALIDPSVAEGDTVSIDVRGRTLTCQVTRPPFVASHAR
jgi:aminomethyltransferase